MFKEAFKQRKKMIKNNWDPGWHDQWVEHYPAKPKVAGSIP